MDKQKLKRFSRNINKNYKALAKGEYRTLPNYPDYWIFADGTIYSLYKHRFLNPYKQYKRNKDKDKDKDKKSGYFIMMVDLTDADGNSKKWSVHRAVATAWKPNHDTRYNQIHHIDEDTTNNSIFNLIWTSSKSHTNINARYKIYKELSDFDFITRLILSNANGELIAIRNNKYALNYYKNQNKKGA